MKITVLNGSPKGEISVTLQYVKYIQKNCPDCEFAVFHVGREIKSIERKPELFDRIIEEVSGSDGVLWCAPVYILLVPSQLKRFIELIFERGAEDAFKDKYGTTFATSAHFCDHTAHKYLHAVSEDLEMRYVDGYSAEFNDLLKPDERIQILNFAERFFRYIEKKEPTSKAFMSISREMPEYVPGKIDDVPKSSNRGITLITDSTERDSNLERRPPSFLGVGGHKVFRDLIYGMKGVLKADHEFYRDNHLYDFPQKDLKLIALNLMFSSMRRIPSLRSKMYKDGNKRIIGPLEKVLRD